MGCGWHGEIPKSTLKGTTRNEIPPSSCLDSQSDGRCRSSSTECQGTLSSCPGCSDSGNDALTPALQETLKA